MSRKQDKYIFVCASVHVNQCYVEHALAEGANITGTLGAGGVGILIKGTINDK